MNPEQLPLALGTPRESRPSAQVIPLARRQDPSTSHDAAAQAAEFAGEHERPIGESIARAGAYGATAKEIARDTGLTDVQVNRRLGAMGERGLITRRLRKGAVTENDFERRGKCAIWWSA